MNTPSSTTNTKKRKVVHFLGYVQVRPFPRWDAPARRAAWYSVQEMKDLQHQAALMIIMASKGVNKNDDDSFLRGLEVRLPSIARQRQGRRVRSIGMVVTGQQRQGVCPERLAKDYRDLTLVSRIEAYKQGVQDELDAVRQEEEDDDESVDRMDISIASTESSSRESRFPRPEMRNTVSSSCA